MKESEHTERTAGKESCTQGSADGYLGEDQMRGRRRKERGLDARRTIMGSNGGYSQGPSFGFRGWGWAAH